MLWVTNTGLVAYSKKLRSVIVDQIDQVSATVDRDWTDLFYFTINDIATFRCR